jgi:hypothetical protein
MANPFDEFKAVPKSDFDEFREAPNPNQVLKFGKNTGSQAHFESLPLDMQDRMLAAAEAYNLKTGKQLQINSSFRSADDQKRLYDETVAAGRPGIGPNGQQVAPPGKSKHGTGYAIDIQQGIDDPDARAVLQQYGFQHGGKGDAMHFGYDPKSVYPQAPAQPGAAPKPVTPQAQPQAQPQMPPESGFDRTLAGISGFGQGATSGLIQYPQALALKATRAMTGGAPMTYEQSLQEVQQGQGQLQQQYPMTYGAGEVGGSLASFLGGTKLATAGLSAGQKAVGLGTKLAAPTMVGAVQSGTAEATKPGTTLSDIGTSAAIGGGLGFGGGLLGAGVEAGVTKLGEASVRQTLRSLIDADTKSSKKAINELVGPSYKEVQKIIEAEKPVYTPPSSEGKRASVYLKEVKEAEKEHAKEVAKWEKKNPLLTGNINDFTQRFIDNPKLINKYPELTASTPYQQAMSKMPEGMKRVQYMSDLTGLATGAGLGGTLGVGYGAYTGDENYLRNLTLGAVGGAAARTGAVKYMYSPKLQQVGQGVMMTPSATGTYLAPTLTDYLNRRNK